MDQVPEIRQATIEDLEALLPLVERFFAEEGFQAPPGGIRASLVEMLQEGSSAVFFGSLAGRIMGVATVTTSNGLELGLSAELEDLYVLPEARGTGVGRALIEAVKNWCRARACSVVSVVVTPEGQAAHNLVAYYARRGFVETGRTLLFAYLADKPSLDEKSAQ